MPLTLFRNNVPAFINLKPVYSNALFFFACVNTFKYKVLFKQ